MSNLDKELDKILSRLNEVCTIAAIHGNPYRGGDLKPLIKQTVLKELKKNKPKEKPFTTVVSEVNNYNQALSDFEAVLDTVLGGKE